MRDTVEEEFEYAMECPECGEGELFAEGDRWAGEEWCDNCEYRFAWDDTDRAEEYRRDREDADAEHYLNHL